jgi:PAS domain S-box-containing protein
MFTRWTAGENVSYHDAEYRITRPDGAVRWIHDGGVISFDKHGRPYRVSGISADVSDRKRARRRIYRTLLVR